jgi:hypothetical protein
MPNAGRLEMAAYPKEIIAGFAIIAVIVDGPVFSVPP